MSTTQRKKEYSYRMATNGLQVCNNGVTNSKIKPFVFVHGTCTDAMVFRMMLQILEAMGILAYSIELRYHDKELYPGELKNLGKVTRKQNARDVRKVVERIGHCTLLGWSMGGRIAIDVAKVCDNVDRVVTLASMPDFWVFLGWKATFTMMHWYYLIAMLGRMPFCFFEKHVRGLMLSDEMSATEAHTVMVKLRASSRMDSGQYLREVAFPTFEAKTKVPCPMLVVATCGDKLLPDRIQLKLKEFHGADWLKIHGSHLFVFEEEACKIAIKCIVEWVVRQEERKKIQPKPIFEKPSLVRSQLAHK